MTKKNKIDKIIKKIWDNIPKSLILGLFFIVASIYTGMFITKYPSPILGEQFALILITSSMLAIGVTILRNKYFKK